MIKLGNFNVNLNSNISKVYLGDKIVWPIPDNTPEFNPFILEISISDGEIGNEILFPFNIGSNTLVDWGDNSTSIGKNRHVYLSGTTGLNNTFSVKVYGPVLWGSLTQSFSYNLRGISHWGDDFRFNANGAFQNAIFFNLENVQGRPHPDSPIYNSTFRGCGSLTSIANMESWDTKNMTSSNLSYWFMGCTRFNMDLSQLDVSHIPSEPINFSNNTPNWTLPKPNWGA